MNIQNSIPNVLLETKRCVFDLLRLELKNIVPIPESKNYCAHTFELDNRKIIFRKARITPKKDGQFVAIWRRNRSGETQPYALLDAFDFLVVNIASQNRLGQFVFPKSVLILNRIVSCGPIEGKRGIRVYSPWDSTPSRQSIKTKNWQADYFVEIKSVDFDLEKAKRLYFTDV